MILNYKIHPRQYKYIFKRVLTRWKNLDYSKSTITGSEEGIQRDKLATYISTPGCNRQHTETWIQTKTNYYPNNKIGNVQEITSQVFTSDFVFIHLYPNISRTTRSNAFKET